MSKPVEVLGFAKDDIDQVLVGYNRHSPGLGDSFIYRLDEAIENIADFPEMYQFAEGDIRKAPIKRFPWAIAYRVLSTVAEVIGVFPEAGDPRLLRARLEALSNR